MDHFDYTTAIFAAVIVSIAVLSFTHLRRSFSKAYIFDGRGRHSSIAKTPPRSLSPEATSRSAPKTTYEDIFPPSTREQLHKVLPSAAEYLNEDEFKKSLIPFEASYKECGPSTYTPMGVTLGEVEALGDFPNYAELSEVPLPSEYKEFKLEAAVARPYRPFRWAYHQTMSLTKLETDWWLEIEKTYASTVKHRIELFEKHGKAVLDYLPGSELAAKELMEIALQFYCARHPKYFSLRKDAAEGFIFINRILNTATIIKDHHPLHVLLRNIPEDFAIMIRHPEDGYYYLRGGIICSSLGWSLGTKMGMQLKEIHDPIPDYKEKMEFSMDRYFSKLPPSKPIQRGSWGLEIDTPLFMPPGDPHESHRLSQNPSLTISSCNLRVDWQSLRRLPLSGAIIFNFRALFSPIEDFREEPYIPALVGKVLMEGKRSIMEYKNTWHTEHVVLPKLREWEEEQVRKGWVERGWEVRTLGESPFFPGWEQRWRGRQGF